MFARYVIPISKRVSTRTSIPRARFSVAAIRYARPAPKPLPKPVRRARPSGTLNTRDGHLSESFFPARAVLDSAKKSGIIALSPDQSLKALNRYISLAKTSRRDWETEIIQESSPGAGDGVSPSILGRLGMITRRGGSQGHQALAHALTKTASKLGDVGAITDLLGGAMNANVSLDPHLTETRERLAAIARDGKNARAILFQGKVTEHMSTKNADVALKWYIKASQVGLSSETGEFASEVSEALCLQGRIYMAKGQTSEAEEVLRKSAVEFDNPEAYYLLGVCQQPLSSFQEVCFLKAAASGISKSNIALAMFYLERSKTEQRKENDLKYALEWLQVGSDGGSVEANELAGLRKALFEDAGKTEKIAGMIEQKVRKYMAKDQAELWKMGPRKTDQ